jgi:RNA polymerase sigma-70 factor (ECF subfamily)
MAETENALLKRALAGADDALAELLEIASPALHADLERDIGARYRGLVEAEDVLQVTFLEAFLRIRSLEAHEPGAFFGWLRRIARHNLLDAIKELERDKRPPPGRRAVAAADESYAALVDYLAVTSTTPSRVVGAAEVRQCVDQALRQLPPDYEQALRLYELEGLSGEEVAERLGRRPGAVRMLLARARQRLGELLAADPQFASVTRLSTSSLEMRAD